MKPWFMLSIQFFQFFTQVVEMFFFCTFAISPFLSFGTLFVYLDFLPPVFHPFFCKILTFIHFCLHSVFLLQHISSATSFMHFTMSFHSGWFIHLNFSSVISVNLFLPSSCFNSSKFHFFFFFTFPLFVPFSICTLELLRLGYGLPHSLLRALHLHFLLNFCIFLRLVQSLFDLLLFHWVLTMYALHSAFVQTMCW